jgi:hypothetical protein
MKNITTLALAVGLLLDKAGALLKYGHFFVTRIAQDDMQFSKMGQDAFAKANQMLDIYAKAFPNITYLERDHRFVECSTFADEIKPKGGAFQSSWHAVNLPYLDQGGTLDDYPEFVLDTETIDKAIPAIIDWLKGGDPNYQDSFVY